MLKVVYSLVTRDSKQKLDPENTEKRTYPTFVLNGSFVLKLSAPSLCPEISGRRMRVKVTPPLLGCTALMPKHYKMVEKHFRLWPKDLNLLYMWSLSILGCARNYCEPIQTQSASNAFHDCFEKFLDNGSNSRSSEKLFLLIIEGSKCLKPTNLIRFTIRNTLVGSGSARNRIRRLHLLAKM